MIENVFEALDYPNEWFYNASTQQLYLIPNATVPDHAAGVHAPPADTTLVAVLLETLISINGTVASTSSCRIIPGPLWNFDIGCGHAPHISRLQTAMCRPRTLATRWTHYTVHTLYTRPV